ncbi:stage II sporulation protein R [Salsuginibacillus kocurii]|uniref:stage II sporulation protein R n=1 Tax=Salsuginibacillus kocurii TaxID=427078 RepID=UPI00037A8F62|nr:stage II sporulation protein R [Salsuginibacillus kocurii]
MNVKRWCALILLGTTFIFLWEVQQMLQAQETEVPDQAIRLQVVAHSDGINEQQLKAEMRDQINVHVRQEVGELNTKQEAREAITSELEELQEIAERTLATYGREGENVSVELEEEVSFPSRLYGSMLFPAGLYEALVVTIGDGDGENWWCVLFPPLCFVELREGETVEEEETTEVKAAAETESGDNVDYRFFIVDKWNEWFGSE